jgi:uncharacterized protein (DUF1778 family)
MSPRSPRGERTRTARLRPRSDRIEARVSKEQIETVPTPDALRLSEQDRQAFMSALLASPAPAKALEQAAKRYRKRTGPASR